MPNDYIDISFTVLDRVRQGRRLLRDLKTGQIYYDPPEPVVPEGYFDGPPNPPLGVPEVFAVREPETEVNAVEPELEPVEVPYEPVKPARKPRKKNG